MSRKARKPILSKRLPILILVIGGILSLFLWYSLRSISLPPDLFNTGLSWLVLIASISIVILCAAMTYLILLIQERKTTQMFLANEAKKELAERLKAEALKQNLEIALIQGQKLQAIGTLAGGIAHDFNNLLYAIKGFTEMCMEDTEKNTLVYKNLGRVLEATQRAQDLVARILAFGRSEQSFEMTAIPLQSTIEGILELLRPTIPAGVNIHLKGMSDDPQILGNQTQLHQVIVNIIINAVDAMEGEGTITIQLSHVPREDSYLQQFPDIKNTSYCKIEISDTGHGMDKTTMERIFEPFYTTKEVGKGTGLGLAMVYSIINQHQGKITVSSQLGRGTIFTILLPEQLAPSRAQRTKEQEKSSSAKL